HQCEKSFLQKLSPLTHRANVEIDHFGLQLPNKPVKKGQNPDFNTLCYIYVKKLDSVMAFFKKISTKQQTILSIRTLKVEKLSIFRTNEIFMISVIVWHHGNDIYYHLI
ncbi:TPA: hypothetical protein I7774_23880, partial [Vibrio vulnificus]|nr:hypothetical protein [Vibrio vulnificus]